MAEHKDMLLRQLTLLQLIPRMPGRIATTVLRDKLAERGFEVDLRTLQRDLKNKLSLVFPLISHEEERPFRWSFDADAQLNLPSIDTPRALALYMAEEHLKDLLPQTVLDQLSPDFNAARNHLSGLKYNELGHWSEVVRAVPTARLLKPAEIKTEVWAKVSESLLRHHQLEVVYLSRSRNRVKTLTLHPAGLIVRDTVSYLVARVNDYDDLRQFALHRIQKCELLEKPARQPDDFSIDAFIDSPSFTRSEQARKVKLIADIHPQVAWKLTETPLSSKQKIKAIDQPKNWFRLETQVNQDQETFWWIVSLGHRIRVHQPLEWVDEIKASLKETQALYV